MRRRQLTPQDLLNPNPALARELHDRQSLFEKEFVAAKAKGLNDKEANFEAEYRASVELPRLRERRAIKKTRFVFSTIIAVVLIWAWQSGRLSNMSIGQFWPVNSKMAVLFCVFILAQFENERFVRARSRGLVGASIFFGAFVGITHFVTLLFSIVWLVAYGYDKGWQSAVGIFILGWLVLLVVSMIMSMIIRSIQNATLNQWEKEMKYDEGTMGDSLILWVLGTFALWPLMIMLATWVSWFGIWR